jgi:hypothetical protein
MAAIGTDIEGQPFLPGSPGALGDRGRRVVYPVPIPGRGDSYRPKTGAQRAAGFMAVGAHTTNLRPCGLRSPRRPLPPSPAAYVLGLRLGFAPLR